MLRPEESDPGLETAVADDAPGALEGEGQGHALGAEWQELVEVLAATEAVCGPDDARLSPLLRAMALFLKTRGRSQQAVPVLIRALELELPVLGSQHPDVVALSEYLRGEVRRCGFEEDAVEAFDELLAMAAQQPHPLWVQGAQLEAKSGSDGCSTDAEEAAAPTVVSPHTVGSAASSVVAGSTMVVKAVAAPLACELGSVVAYGALRAGFSAAALAWTGWPVGGAVAMAVSSAALGSSSSLAWSASRHACGVASRAACGAAWTGLSMAVRATTSATAAAAGAAVGKVHQQRAPSLEQECGMDEPGF